jgi:hypothetical protein
VPIDQGVTPGTAQHSGTSSAREAACNGARRRAWRRRSAVAGLALLLGVRVLAGQEPSPTLSPSDAAKPADVKPNPTAIDEARAALGESSLQSIRYTGSGTIAASASGAAAGDAAPRIVTRYDVLIDYPASTMQIDVVQGGGDEGASAGTQSHHVEAINGTLAWDTDFVTMAADPAHKKSRGSHTTEARVSSAEPPQLNVAASLLRRQAIWMTPHGFLKAALSNQPALRAAGSGTEVSFYAGTNRYVGFLNSKNQVERVRTWVRRPDLADVLIDTTYTDYALFGNIAFPTRIRQLQDGRPVLDVTVTSVEANARVHIAVPKDVAQARP